MDADERFNALVRDWLASTGVVATSVERVASHGTDWNGDTEGGFYASFDVTIHYRDHRDEPRFVDVEGEAMASLWEYVVGLAKGALTRP